MTVGGGALHIPAAQGDIYGDTNTAKNLVVRAAPTGAWTATTKVAFKGTDQYHQAGMILLHRRRQLRQVRPHRDRDRDRRREVRVHPGDQRRRRATTRRTRRPTSPANFPKDYYLRMVSDGTNVTGAYSTDGTTWTPVGRAAAIPAGAKIGMFAFNNAAATSPGRGLRLVPHRRPRRRRRHAVRPEPRRRLLRHLAGQVALERDRARQPGQVRRSAAAT